MSKTVRFSRRDISRKFQFSGFSLKSEALTLFERELLFNRVLDYDSLDEFVKDVVEVLSFGSKLDFAIVDGNAAEDIIKQLKIKRKPNVTNEERNSNLVVKNVNFDSGTKQKDNCLHYNSLFKVFNEFLSSLSNFKSELVNIDKLITSNRSTLDCVILGFIRRNTRKINEYLIEDNSGEVDIKMNEDGTFQHPVLLENSFVLVEGTYRNEEDRLYVNKIGYVPPQIHLKSEIAETTDATSRMFVILREVYLDDDETFKKLHILFAGYDAVDSCPDCFLFIGPFCADENHFKEAAYFKALMRKFFRLISTFPNISEQSHFVFVPHSECKGNDLIKEPLSNDVIPDEHRTQFSVHLATNPVHIFIGTKHICVHTGDYFKNVRRKMMHNETSNREEYVTAVAKIMLSNAHLTPGSYKALPNSLSLWSLPNVLIFNDEYLECEFEASVLRTKLVNAGSFSRDNFKFKCTNKSAVYKAVFSQRQRRLISDHAIPRLPECDFKPQQFASQLKSATLENIKRHVNPCLAQMYSDPMILTQGHMQYVWDKNGKRYLDMFGGIVTISVGHCHPKLVDAISQQASKLWHVSRAHVYEEIYDYSAKLSQRLPSSLSTIFLCNSGSEANDLALVLARLYTKSFDFIALRNAYHGCSTAAMGLTGIGSWKYNFPNAFGIHHTLNPDPYRGKHGGKACRDSMFQANRECDCKVGECSACDYYINDLEDLLNTSCSQKKVAGFIAESIQGVGGVVQYPKNYLKRAAELIRQRGGVFICDEVQTGFGRTGTNFWGFQNHDVIPDIVTMAKGIGNGFPLAAVATTSEIGAAMNEALYFNTYAGNPLASAVGSKVLDIIDEEKLQENSHHLGTRFAVSLKRLMNQFENLVGDIRGKGLMIGVELVCDKDTKEPLSKVAVNAILDDCKDMGLIIGKGGALGNVLRIKPPMCINDADVQFAVQVLNKSFENHCERKIK